MKAGLRAAVVEQRRRRKVEKWNEVVLVDKINYCHVR